MSRDAQFPGRRHLGTRTAPSPDFARHPAGRDGGGSHGILSEVARIWLSPHLLAAILSVKHSN